MDIELLSAECNLYSNGQFIKKYLCHQNMVYITFKFAPKISSYDICSCYYDFNIFTSYPICEDYILILSNKPTSVVGITSDDQKMLNRAFPGNDYITVTQNKFICLIKGSIILKQGNNVDHMYYFFDTICDYSLLKVNRTWFLTGRAILEELINSYEELKKCETYDSLMTIINNSEDYFSLEKFMNKYPKHMRQTRLQNYIKNEMTVK